jgi:hypothetical protein
MRKVDELLYHWLQGSSPYRWARRDGYTLRLQLKHYDPPANSEGAWVLRTPAGRPIARFKLHGFILWRPPHIWANGKIEEHKRSQAFALSRLEHLIGKDGGNETADLRQTVQA